jgi:uncharacterized protein YutE (UPF0331/DUF86 family)
MREEIIRIKLKDIRDSLEKVKTHLPQTLEEFLDLGLVKDGIYKKVEFMIENVLDICKIINTDLNLGLPKKDVDIIENLVKNEIISKEMGEKIKEMKSFRNILVHRYGKIEDEIAYEEIKNGLKDFEKFEMEIEKFLEKIKKEFIK